MRTLSIGVVILAGIVVALSGCRKLGPADVRFDVAAVGEALPSGNVIPASWGRLAGVSSIEHYPDLVQMWFEDGSGDVRVVVYRVRTGELLSARRIARG